MGQFTGLIGVCVMILLGLALSTNPSKVPWRLVFVGVLVEIIVAGTILWIPGIKDAFEVLGYIVNRIIQMSDAGTDFVFGSALRDPSKPWGFIFAVKVLPIIIFFSALMSVLYYLGVMQRIVAVLAWCLRKTLRVTGAEATCMAANMFIGQTEAPLTIRPLIPRLTRAQLMLVMLGGFAHIAGSVFGAYVMMLGGDNDVSRAAFAKHLIAASVMSAPAAFVMARIIVPEVETPPPEDPASLRAATEEDHANVFDAAAGGATTGMKLAANIAAMLIAFVSLLALINLGLGTVADKLHLVPWLQSHGIAEPSLQAFLGKLFAPLAWTMGIEWKDAPLIGSLLGEKLILTEFVAYLHLADAIHAAPGVADKGEIVSNISPRSAAIAAYALCGFANFASIAIQIGGLSVLAPSRRREFARLAMRAMLGGALATQMVASVAGLFIPA
ncbi:MAG: nucleoside transporter C-terminal domain-containing protein [Phycisphaerales bacterium]|nr:NupC/NupG family nucleoside CNT transporter [Planctomycetota bacterium]